MVNWKEGIYPFKNFTEELAQEWIKVGFNKKETREWLESGLQPTEARFAQWLRDIKKVDAEWFLDEGDEDELKREYNDCLKNNKDSNEKLLLSDNWKNIHPKFAELWHGKTYQERWEGIGLTYEEAKEWVNAGLEIEKPRFANHLKQKGYIPGQLPTP